ncbi:MAG: ATP-binding protein [Methylococcaceae bacterium]
MPSHISLNDTSLMVIPDFLTYFHGLPVVNVQRLMLRVIVLTLMGWSSTGTANNFVTATAFFQDPGNQLTYAEATRQEFHSYTNPFLKGLYHGTTWIKLSFDPGEYRGDRLVLRFNQRNNLDEVALFDPVEAPDTLINPLYTGDRHALNPKDYFALALGFNIPAGHGPRDLYLRLRTTSIHYLDVAVLPPEEVRYLDGAVFFGSMLVWGFLLSVLVWTIRIWWVDREWVIGAFIAKHSIGIVHSFLVLGFGRVLLPWGLGNGRLDMALNIAHILAAGSGFIFELIFLREFNPPKWMWTGTAMLLGLTVAALVLLLEGQVIEALRLNLYLMALGSLGFFALSLAGRVWSEQAHPTGILPRWILAGFHGLLLFTVLMSIPNSLGFTLTALVPRMHDFGLSLYPFLSSVLIMVLLELRRSGRELRRQRDMDRLMGVDTEAREQRRRREEQERFLAMTSHELRTPVNGILGLTELALAPDVSEKERLEYLRQISASGQMLVESLTEVLDISKIESGKLELEQIDFDLNELLDRLASAYTALALSKNLQFSLNLAADMPRFVRGDPSRLRQILVNYLGNALKFTQQGHIMLAASRLDNHRLRFEVRDTGPGLSPAQQLKLFQAYSQADATISRSYGGTGLGLSICRLLAELMAGKVGVMSAEGQGACFWVELALPQVSPPAAHTSTTPPEAGAACLTGLRILVADDNRVNRMVVTRMLEKQGCTVVAVEDGRLAVQAVEASISQNDGFDAVLMDVQMPVMDGLEATRAIRQLDGGGTIPIIALTAGVLTQEREQAYSAGMNDFATKPISIKTLSERILLLTKPRRTHKPAETAPRP